MKSSEIIDNKFEDNKKLKFVVDMEEVKDAVLEDEKKETQDYWLFNPLLCASNQRRLVI